MGYTKKKITEDFSLIEHKIFFCEFAFQVQSLGLPNLEEYRLDRTAPSVLADALSLCIQEKPPITIKQFLQDNLPENHTHKSTLINAVVAIREGVSPQAMKAIFH